MDTGTMIAQVRQKMARGEVVELEEMIAVVRALRQDRFSAVTASATKKAKAVTAAAPINGDDLLGEMMA